MVLPKASGHIVRHSFAAATLLASLFGHRAQAADPGTFQPPVIKVEEAPKPKIIVRTKNYDDDWKPSEITLRKAVWEADKSFGSPWDEALLVLHAMSIKTNEHKGEALDPLDRSKIDDALVGIPYRYAEAVRAYDRRSEQLNGKQKMDMSREEIQRRRDHAKIMKDYLKDLVKLYLREINDNIASTEKPFVSPFK